MVTICGVKKVMPWYIDIDRSWVKSDTTSCSFYRLTPSYRFESMNE